MEVVQTQIVGFLKPTMRSPTEEPKVEFRTALEFEAVEERKRRAFEKWHPIIKETEFLVIREHLRAKDVYKKDYIEKVLDVQFLSEILENYKVKAQIIIYEAYFEVKFFHYLTKVKYRKIVQEINKITLQELNERAQWDKKEKVLKVPRVKEKPIEDLMEVEIDF